MKVNGNKRKIFDAVDLLMDEMTPETNGDGIQLLPVDEIRPFPDHPFHLYEGERLQDMVESVREHGVLNPVIVRKIPEGYEMLSGHNRMNAAKIAGMKEIPAIVKEELSDEEAYVYVIETNVMQRSFTDLAVSEKAAVLKERYDKVICQGKRNDILKELLLLEGGTDKATSDHGGQKLNRSSVGEEYGLSGTSVARYLRINELIPELKQMVDDKVITLRTAVELSFIPEEYQKLVYDISDGEGVLVNEKIAKALKREADNLTEEMVRTLLLPKKESTKTAAVSVQISDKIRKKYFEGMDSMQITEIVEKALDAWFKEREKINI